MPGKQTTQSKMFFVSYAGPDEKWAKWIVWELENASARYRCIAQFKDFAPGMNFMRKMREAAEADCTIALFSSHYFRSKYCGQELDAALTGKEGRLLPIRVSECDPGAFLQNRIYIDLAGKANDDARSALLSGVEAYLALTRGRSGEPRHLKREPFPGKESAEEHPVGKLSPPKPGDQLKVLFVGSNEGGLSPRKQLQAMQNSVAKSRFPRSISFKGVFRVHVNALFTELNREAPQVFHFSGKQNGGDILMRTENGTLTTVSDMALAGMFRSLDQGIQLVVVDTCFSLRCATTIAKVVPCTIGVEGDILEEDAIEFYCRFYQAIASGRSIKDATAQAQSALSLRKKPVPASKIPQLRCRDGIDPARIYLVDSVERRPSGRGASPEVGEQ